MNKMLWAGFLCGFAMFAYAEKSKAIDPLSLAATMDDFKRGFDGCFMQHLNAQECEEQIFKFGTKNLDLNDVKLGLRALKDLYKNNCIGENKKRYECVLMRDMYMVLYHEGLVIKEKAELVKSPRLSVSRRS